MTLSEIARVSTIDEKDISRCYRIIIRELGLHMPVQRAQLNVPKIASKVEVGEETQRKAIEILGEAYRRKITIGKDPMGLAASALYMACVMNEENRTQKMIAEAADVTEVTIRNRYTELKRVLDWIFRSLKSWTEVIAVLLLARAIIREGLMSKLNHAAYLGRELEKAEIAMRLGRSYVQDSAVF